jgi:hypothetical protein
VGDAILAAGLAATASALTWLAYRGVRGALLLAIFRPGGPAARYTAIAALAAGLLAVAGWIAAAVAAARAFLEATG